MAEEHIKAIKKFKRLRITGIMCKIILIQEN